MDEINKNSIANVERIIGNKRQMGKLEQLLSFLPFGAKNSAPLISVLRLSGMIGQVSRVRSGLNLESLNESIEKAFKPSKLTAVCLIVNSPGGSPVQSELIASRIISLAREKKVPVYTFIEDVAASGGYWLACAGDEIYASKSSIIGSIGVISAGFGFQEAINKLGIERRVYTEGKNKSILDPFQEVNSQDIKIIQRAQKQIHEHFIAYVKERRAGKITQDDDILFSGEFWAGESALDFGLIDGVDDMYNFIKNRFGAEAKIEYVAARQSWLKRKLSVSDYLSKSFVDSLIEAVKQNISHDRFDLQ